MMGLIWEPTNGSLKKMRNRILFSFFILLLCFKSPAQEENSYSILFYNTENLFDCEDDPTVNDNEFTPEGDRYWTYHRFIQKINNLSKAIIAASAWDKPAIIGVCEVENRFVLEQLCSKTALQAYPLQIIHKESPDPRGIDVALMYNSDLFKPIQYDYFPLLNEDGNIRRTREILFLKGKFKDSEDTVHVFVNHWPSRYSGLLETTEWRNKAAQLLKQKTDSLFHLSVNSKIIIMGDFNDQPGDTSVLQLLQAQPVDGENQAGKLYNLSSNWGEKGKGSLKYQSQWFVFDQAIVSASLITDAKNRGLTISEASIESAGFLLEQDERYGGERPMRTYYGYDYRGGFSDHLPVKIKIKLR